MTSLPLGIAVNASIWGVIAMACTPQPALNLLITNAGDGANTMLDMLLAKKRAPIATWLEEKGERAKTEAGAKAVSFKLRANWD